MERAQPVELDRGRERDRRAQERRVAEEAIRVLDPPVPGLEPREPVAGRRRVDEAEEPAVADEREPGVGDEREEGVGPGRAPATVVVAELVGLEGEPEQVLEDEGDQGRRVGLALGEADHDVVAGQGPGDPLPAGEGRPPAEVPDPGEVGERAGVAGQGRHPVHVPLAVPVRVDVAALDQLHAGVAAVLQPAREVLDQLGTRDHVRFVPPDEHHEVRLDRDPELGSVDGTPVEGSPLPLQELREAGSVDRLLEGPAAVVVLDHRHRRGTVGVGPHDRGESSE